MGIISLREGKAEICTPFRRSDLRSHIILGQIDAVVIRFCRLGLMREPACTAVLVDFQSSCHRHQGKLPVVIYPRAWLMRLFESPDLV